MQNPSICDCVIRYVKEKNIQILKIFQVKKCLIGKLVLACEDKILNTTEIPIEDIKETCQKSLMLVNITYHFYQLSLLLYKILDKKRTLIAIFI